MTTTTLSEVALSRQARSLTEAIRALGLRPGPPTEADVPPPTPLPGKKVKPIKGQLDFFGGEIGAKEPDDTADGDGEP